MSEEGTVWQPAVGDVVKINHLPLDIIVCINDNLLNPIQTKTGYGFSYPSKLNKITYCGKAIP